MHYTSLGYEHKSGFGSVIVRGNVHRRFSLTGFQFETDFYPKIGQKTYAYLNYGASRSILFPKNRFGAEIFTALQKDMEISLGARLLQYPTENTTLVTASVAKYLGQWYLVGRPYLAIRESGQIGFSMTANLRKYVSDQEYFFANLGLGNNPEIWSYQDENIKIIKLYNINNQFVDIGYRFNLNTSGDMLQCHFRVNRQEKLLEPKTYLWAFQIGLSYALNL